MKFAVYRSVALMANGIHTAKWKILSLTSYVSTLIVICVSFNPYSLLINSLCLRTVETGGEGMKNPFDYTSASWVKYSQYEWKKATDGILYLTPTEKAEPWSYDPLQNAETLVRDALDIALLCFHKSPNTEIQSAILRFARKYGLLGIMTALPTTARFVSYEKVYFLKNQFITEEAMDTRDYVSLSFPFTKLDFSKRGVESVWNISDKKMIALAMTYQTSPQAQVMSFMRNYAERYDCVQGLGVYVLHVLPLLSRL